MKTENGAATEYVYNALNQLVSDSEITYEYDLNGNLIRVIGTAHSALYEYNSENKLVKATVQTGSLVTEESYTYDYQGNRTSKTTHKSNGEFEYTKYLNDNSSLTNVLAEIDENGTAKCVYTIGADLVSQERDGKVSVYLYDGHGSVVGLANESGVVTDTYSYDAFGNLLKSKGSTKNCYRYCGEQFDETTGLYYLRARYMDTSTGRFISQDTYQGDINDPISLHKYLYANANPVMYIDQSGYLAQAVALKYEFQHDFSVLRIGQKIISMLLVAKPLFVYGMTVGVLIGAMFSSCLSSVADGSLYSDDVADSIRDIAIDEVEEQYDDDGKYKILNIGAGLIPYSTQIANVEVHNIDINGDGIFIKKGDAYNLTYPSGYFHEVFCFNPYGYDVLESDVPRTMKNGAIITITGNLSNKYFNKIYGGKAKSDDYANSHGFIVLSRLDECENQYRQYNNQTQGSKNTNIKKIPHQITLRKG